MLEGKPRQLVEQVLSFSGEVGLPLTLADIGLKDITPEMLQQVARRTCAEGETIHNEPFDVNPEMAADAIRAADATGRDWKKRTA